MVSSSRVSQNFVTMSREWAEVGPLPVLVSGAAIPMMDVRSLISGKIFSRIPVSNRESGILFYLGSDKSRCIMRRRPHVTDGTTLWQICLLFLAVLMSTVSADDSTNSLSQGLVFYASFDDGTDANLSTDSGWIHTADSMARKTVQQGNHRKDVTVAKGAGRFGDSLRFTAVSRQVLLYKGVNVEYREKDWSGTVAFWLKLDPNKDLKPGYCDPIQITDKKWNDAAMWVDFDKDLPRDFRLGVFPNYRLWNPNDTPDAKIPSSQRPWIRVENPPFNREKWTHVAWTFANVNSDDDVDATVALYLDGTSQGTLRRPLRFDWKPDDVAIFLGINYVGDFDDLVIFNRALSAPEIRQLGKAPAGGLKALRQEP